jgi:hypothetical protein
MQSNDVATSKRMMILLLCLIFSALAEQQAGQSRRGHHGHQPVALNYCKRVLGTLEPEQIRVLHDSMAQMQLHSRRMTRSTINLDRLNGTNPHNQTARPKEHAMWIAAYQNHSLSYAEIRAQHEYEKAAGMCLRACACLHA